MDRQIIVPGTDRKWHVSSILDRRINDHQKVIELDSQSLIEPKEKKFIPSPDFLKCQEERLLS